MAPKRTVTVKIIQSFLSRVGGATSGTKADLVTRLTRVLEASKEASKPLKPTQNIRVLSIDMGIRNLAFCVADVRTKKVAPNEKASIPDLSSMEMAIQAWRKLDVEEEVAKLAIGSLRRSKANLETEEEGYDPYAPSTLSSTAYTLLTKTLLPYKPDVILIERQRWRSASGPAIQQWTVRVNTLEGMLWAILTALRADGRAQGLKSGDLGTDYEIVGVDPKRVGHFWIGEDVRAAVKGTKSDGRKEEELDVVSKEDIDTITASVKSSVKRPSRSKAEKKAKIAILKSWFNNATPSTTTCTNGPNAQNPIIRFSFSRDADVIRQILCSTDKMVTKRGAVAELKKLDDVTDCFLQAAAWVAWERNRVVLGREWEENGEDLDGLLLGREGEEDGQGGNKTRKKRITKKDGNEEQAGEKTRMRRKRSGSK